MSNPHLPPDVSDAKLDRQIEDCPNCVDGTCQCEKPDPLNAPNDED